MTQLESLLRGRLPERYREFLLCCGHGAGDFLRGTDWTCEKLLDIQTSASALLRACGSSFALAEQDFVLAMHQGYQFLFIPRGGDDPPVRHFLQGDEVPRLVFDRFTQWLAQCVDDEIAAFQELQG